MKTPPPSTHKRLRAIAKAFKRLVRAFLNIPKVEGNYKQTVGKWQN